MSEDISLKDLLDVSFPRAGVVNYSALHTLLGSMLGHTNIQSHTVKWTTQPPVRLTGTDTGPRARTEETDTQELHTGTEPPSSSITPGKEEDTMMQLHSRVQTNESTPLIRDVLKEIQDQKEFSDNLKKEIKELHNQLERVNVGDLEDRVTAAENCCHRVDELEAATRSLSERVQRYPDPELLDQCVTWDMMQSALVSERENRHKELSGSGTIDLTTEAKPKPSRLTPRTSVPSDTSAPSTTGPLTAPAPSSPVTPGKPLTKKPSTPPSPSPPTNTGLTVDSQRENVSPVQGATTVALPQRTRSDTDGASGAERSSLTMEALRDVGKLRERHDNLEARVMTLETDRVDQAQLAGLKKLIADMGARDLPDNLTDQLNSQRVLIDGRMSDREKLDKEEMSMNLGSQGKENTPEAASEHVDSERAHELRQQLSYLRMVVQKLVEDVKQLEGRGAEQRKTDRHLQDQLDNLRGMLEDGTAGQDQNDSQGQVQDQSASATASTDVGRKLSQVFSRYEMLQDTVSGILQRPGGQAEATQDTENVELMDDVQKAMRQLQAECEQLTATTTYLVEDNSQQQSLIEKLYKAMDELEEKKADKQLVEMEIDILQKADKCALESKVSRLQFDSTTEQLNAMFHELLSKVTGQEQDWHKVIDKLSTEMECKLNRELDPVKKQLEDRWKSIRKKLQAQPALECKDAALVKRQLVARFHCISCDRPVIMNTTGPQFVVAPYPEPLHWPLRPYSLYVTPEHGPQHYPRQKPANKLCQYGKEDTDHTVTRGQYAPTGPLQTNTHNRTMHKRIPEMSENYINVARRCDLTVPNPKAELRVTGGQLQLELDIKGLEGYDYKGHLNTQGNSDEGMFKKKGKAKPPQPQRPGGSPKGGHGGSPEGGHDGSPEGGHDGSPEAGHDDPLPSAKSQRSSHSASSSQL